MIHFFFCAVILFSASQVYAEPGVWLLVDTQAQTLEVKNGPYTLALFKDIAIGRRGAGFKQHRGDEVTPLGFYRIAWINEKSHYRRFYGFDYPSVDDARKALRHGLISSYEFQRIIDAHKHNEVPPQNTALGGMLSIHGLGRADERIHKMTNWTKGCVALTNDQIDLLALWIEKGTKVVILKFPRN